MSSNINNILSDFNSYLESKGISNAEVSTADLVSIFQQCLDEDDDGDVTVDDFADAFAEEYSIEDLEEDYLDVIEALADCDGDNDTISYNDLTAANTADLYSSNYKIQYSDTNDYLQASTSVTLDNDNGTTTTVSTNIDAVDADGLSSLSPEKLYEGRSDILSKLSTLKQNRDDAIQNNATAINNAESALYQAEQLYIQAMNDLQDSNESSDDTIAAYLQNKNSNQQNISDQETIIDGINDSISSAQSKINELKNSEPNEDGYTDDNGNVSEEYTADYQAWEEAKNTAEEELAGLELELVNAEMELENLESADKQLDERIMKDISSSKVLDNSSVENVQKAYAEYTAAQAALEKAQTTVEIAQYDADIAQLEANLAVYETAIAAKEAEDNTDTDGLGAEALLENGTSTNTDEDEDDEEDETDDDKDNYVLVESYSSDNDSNNCLSRIIQNNYDLEAMGIETYSDEYYALEKAVMDANPDIYGTEDGGWRDEVGGTGRENAVLYPGDEIILPDYSTTEDVTGTEEEENDAQEAEDETDVEYYTGTGDLGAEALLENGTSTNTDEDETDYEYGAYYTETVENEDGSGTETKYDLNYNIISKTTYNKKGKKTQTDEYVYYGDGSYQVTTYGRFGFRRAVYVYDESGNLISSTTY